MAILAILQLETIDEKGPPPDPPLGGAGGYPPPGGVPPPPWVLSQPLSRWGSKMTDLRVVERPLWDPLLVGGGQMGGSFYLPSSLGHLSLPSLPPGGRAREPGGLPGGVPSGGTPPWAPGPGGPPQLGAHPHGL